MAKDKQQKGRRPKGKQARAREQSAAAAPLASPPPVPSAAPVAATPVASPAPVPPPVPAPDSGRVSFGLGRVANALGGARLCYGEPVHVGERVVIPVARVRGAGGYGFGRGTSQSGEDEGDGGGGGGALEATPAGFLDITPDGVRYEAIPDPVTTARALSTGASALALLLSTVLGVRRAVRRRSAAGLPPPSA